MSYEDNWDNNCSIVVNNLCINIPHPSDWKYVQNIVKKIINGLCKVIRHGGEMNQIA